MLFEGIRVYTYIYDFSIFCQRTSLYIYRYDIIEVHKNTNGDKHRKIRVLQ